MRRAAAFADSGRFNRSRRSGSDFRDAVIAGLSKAQKAVPSKFLYDTTGSRLFDRICELDEYYPTRTERAILRGNANAIAAALPEEIVIIEPGAGSSLKIADFLGALDRPRAYVPVDISGEHLMRSAVRLAADHPNLTVVPVCADFTETVDLPPVPSGPRLAFFPGSTIGNLEAVDAVDFLSRLVGIVGAGGFLLIGVDLEKDPAILWRAYNDERGVTAAFNRNLLERINRELGGSFEKERFRHHAPYVAERGRVEMHLVSEGTRTVRVADRLFVFKDGETIHTENSHKYTINGFRALAARAGVTPLDVWVDPRRLFSVHLFQVPSSGGEVAR